MKINFNNREIELKFNFRSDMIYENIQKKSFKAETETDWVVYFYSTYLSLTQDTQLDFDTCVDLLSEDPGVLFMFIKWYTDYQTNVLNIVNHPEEGEGTEDEKNA